MVPDTFPAWPNSPEGQLALFDATSAGPGAQDVESYELADGGLIWREVLCRDGSRTRSAVRVADIPGKATSLASLYDQAWLRSQAKPEHASLGASLRVADLFAGCGGLTLGVWEACRALQRSLVPAFAAEFDPVKLAVYKSNFSPLRAAENAIEDIVDGELGARPTAAERRLVADLGDIDFIVGGPPCQGHSDLNNHTRRKDPKNGLLLRLVRFAELFRPRHILVENVQGIRHDKHMNVDLAEMHFRRLGYTVTSFLLAASRFGLPQNRRRFFMVASQDNQENLFKRLDAYEVPVRPMSWACSDLMDVNRNTIFDTAAVHSPENQARIRYLFENDVYDLPDHVRPDCHRLKKHAYNAVYGRMRWDEPAPTITTGFGSTGQGRFVHPLRPRTLTPHEAARLQFLPDFFRFGDAGRTQLQKMIGNAVPPKLAYIVALELLR